MQKLLLVIETEHNNRKIERKSIMLVTCPEHAAIQLAEIGQSNTEYKLTGKLYQIDTNWGKLIPVAIPTISFSYVEVDNGMV